MRSPLSHCYYPTYSLQVDLATFDDHVGVTTNYFKIVRNLKLIQEMNGVKLKSSVLKTNQGIVRITTLGKHVLLSYLNTEKQRDSYMVLYRHKKGLNIQNFLQQVDGLSMTDLVKAFNCHLKMVRKDEKVRLEFVV